MEGYREFIEKLARDPSGTAAYSRSPEQDSVALANLFASAKSEIRLLSPNLDVLTFGREELQLQTLHFLARSDSSLRILVESEPIPSTRHPFLRLIRDFPDNTDLLYVPEDFQERYKFSMVLADDHSYWFRSDRETSDATVAFGDIETAHENAGAIIPQ